jgi:hypothetical protein
MRLPREPEFCMPAEDSAIWRSPVIWDLTAGLSAHTGKFCRAKGDLADGTPGKERILRWQEACLDHPMPSMNPVLYSPNFASPPTAAGQAAGSHFSFHDILDIVNPLQHLPVVGTLYRAITGDGIGKFEKVAGDTLYGGLWGAVSSVADLAFEAVTGKDIGDTVLALFDGKQEPKSLAVADNGPNNATGPASPADSRAATPDIAALTSALQQKGVDDDTAQRALLAYRKSTGLPTLALAGQ